MKKQFGNLDTSNTLFSATSPASVPSSNPHVTQVHCGSVGVTSSDMSSEKKVIRGIQLFLTLGILLLIVGCDSKSPPQLLHIYNWAESMDMSIIKDFEKETGIKVIYDAYESNDVLEAKLLTSQSGYDIVFPSSYPYLARQIKAGIYHKLDHEKLPALKSIDTTLYDLLDKIPNARAYAIPYLWSITGIGYRADLVHKALPQAPVESLKMLFDKEVVRSLSKYGVALLAEAIDVIPLALFYLGLPPDSSDPEHIKQAVALLKRIRPYISQFASIRPTEDLLTGDMAVVQTWLGFILEIKARGSKMKPAPDIRFSIPQEGTSLWLDVIAIPKDAPHLENAYVFINFLLRPENMAKITHRTYYNNAVPASYPLIKQEIREMIEFSSEIKQKIFITKVVSRDHMKALAEAFQAIQGGE